MTSFFSFTDGVPTSQSFQSEYVLLVIITIQADEFLFYKWTSIETPNPLQLLNRLRILSRFNLTFPSSVTHLKFVLEPLRWRCLDQYSSWFILTLLNLDTTVNLVWQYTLRNVLTSTHLTKGKVISSWELIFKFCFGFLFVRNDH